MQIAAHMAPSQHTYLEFKTLLYKLSFNQTIMQSVSIIHTRDHFLQFPFTNINEEAWFYKTESLNSKMVWEEPNNRT